MAKNIAQQIVPDVELEQLIDGLRQPEKDDLAEVLLRRARLAAVRRDHAAAGVLPDRDRARHHARQHRRDREPRRQAGEPDRVRQRLQPQDPRAARTPRRTRRLRARRHLGRSPARIGAADSRRLSRPRRAAGGGRLHASVPAALAEGHAGAQHRLFPGLDDRQFHERGGPGASAGHVRAKRVPAARC